MLCFDMKIAFDGPDRPYKWPIVYVYIVTHSYKYALLHYVVPNNWVNRK